MINEADVYRIGVITRTHGVRGEVAFQFTDDVWDRVEADYLLCRMDGLLVPFFLEEWRFKSDTTALLKFEGVETANDAARMVGAEVCFPRDLTPTDIDQEELTWKMFTGFEVIQEETGTLLGVISLVEDSTANILLTIEKPDGSEFFLPAHEEFILHADHRERRMWVQVPEDLLNLNA